MIREFINQYGMMLLYAALTAIAGFIGTQIKRLYKKITDDETKRKVVETCVKAVEQLYRDLSGPEKLEKAKENILAMLAQKGIDIAEIEMDLLIEACVAELKFKEEK